MKLYRSLLSSVLCWCLVASGNQQNTSNGEGIFDSWGRHTGIWAIKFKFSDIKSYQQLADEFADFHGLVNKGAVGEFADIFELSLKERDKRSLQRSGLMEQFHYRLKDTRGHYVEWSEGQWPLKRVTRDVENIFTDPEYYRQWHLHNKYEPLHDLNITTVWKYNISGAGVTVCVVDDGVERFNTDLVDNFCKDGSYDFTDEDSDPSPTASNAHGTRCAGLIAAMANNGVCGVGVAHGAHVSGIRMLDGVVTDIKEAKSFSFKVQQNDIFSCSWGPEDDGKQVDGPGTLAMSMIKLAIEKGRHGYGNIYVVASGNGGYNHDDCNYDGYANSPYTVTIGAIDEHNSLPYYGEPCAAILAVTYSSGATTDRFITTTDVSVANDNGCTNRFSGTSAAAPLAAGVLALVLQVRPCLTWRDVQHLIAYTAVKVDVRGARWVRNTAGFYHSREHGFGRLDAFRIAMAAKVWPLLPSLITWESHDVDGGNIPGRKSNLESSLSVSGVPEAMMSLEHVSVWVEVSHTCRGVLQFELVSPGNTTALLAQPRPHDCSGEKLSWTYSTVMFWGESSVHGTWRLKVTDTKSHNSMGKLLQWKLILWGSSTSSENIVARKRLIETAVNDGVNSSLWLQCPPPPQGHDITYKEPFSSSRIVQYIGVFILVVGVVWLGDVVGQYLYRRVRKTCCIPQTVPVRYHHGNGIDDEEQVELLEQQEENDIADLPSTGSHEQINLQEVVTETQ